MGCRLRPCTFPRWTRTPCVLFYAGAQMLYIWGGGDASELKEDVFEDIAQKHPGAAVLLAGGPPCMGVSFLRGPCRPCAFGATSRLREDFRRVWAHLSGLAPGKVWGLMECTRMDEKDRLHYDSVFGTAAILVDAALFSPVARPRFWWASAPLVLPDPFLLRAREDGARDLCVNDEKQVIRPISGGRPKWSFRAWLVACSTL